MAKTVGMNWYVCYLCRIYRSCCRQANTLRVLGPVYIVWNKSCCCCCHQSCACMQGHCEWDWRSWCTTFAPSESTLQFDKAVAKLALEAQFYPAGMLKLDIIDARNLKLDGDIPTNPFATARVLSNLHPVSDKTRVDVRGRSMPVWESSFTFAIVDAVEVKVSKYHYGYTVRVTDFLQRLLWT